MPKTQHRRRALIGDEDGHVKNYSLIHAEGSVTAAPLYDSLCTLAYPDLSGTTGAPIGAQRSLARSMPRTGSCG